MTTTPATEKDPWRTPTVEEVHASELPSPCNVYLSGRGRVAEEEGRDSGRSSSSSSCARDGVVAACGGAVDGDDGPLQQHHRAVAKGSDGRSTRRRRRGRDGGDDNDDRDDDRDGAFPIMKFATERHSVTILRGSRRGRGHRRDDGGGDATAGSYCSHFAVAPSRLPRRRRGGASTAEMAAGGDDDDVVDDDGPQRSPRNSAARKSSNDDVDDGESVGEGAGGGDCDDGDDEAGGRPSPSPPPSGSRRGDDDDDASSSCVAHSSCSVASGSSLLSVRAYAISKKNRSSPSGGEMGGAGGGGGATAASSSAIARAPSDGNCDVQVSQSDNSGGGCAGREGAGAAAGRGGDDASAAAADGDDDDAEQTSQDAVVVGAAQRGRRGLSGSDAAAASSSPSSSDHHLAIRIRRHDGVGGHHRNNARSVTEFLPLDYRPMSVHATELVVRSEDGDGDDDDGGAESNDRPSSAVGIFVASVDDDVLRLYVATSVEALLPPRDDVRRSDCDRASFVPLALLGEISDKSEGKASDDDVDDPFRFPAPLTAVTACVTEEGGEEYSGNRRMVNRLAAACRDGTVRIITFRLVKRRKDGMRAALRCSLERHSTFVVDGPISSLDFGTTAAGDPGGRREPPPQLFLAVGSLCGFACIFYESPMPPGGSPERRDADVAPFFDGPLSIVDGLYDARHDGCEECVTSVHVCGDDGDQNVIIVGTEGGRILLFQRCPKDDTAMKEKDDLRERLQQESSEILSKMDSSKEEISKLRSELRDMNINRDALTGSLSEKQQRIGEVETQCPRQDFDSTAEDEDEPEHSEKSLVSLDEKEGEVSNLIVELDSIRSEITLLEQNIADHTSRIAKLALNVEDFTGQNNAMRRKIHDYDAIQASFMLRKTHRYQLLCEYHLPYPIQGVSSSSKDGEIHIFVTTRMSFHVLLFSA